MSGGTGPASLSGTRARCSSGMSHGAQRDEGGVRPLAWANITMFQQTRAMTEQMGLCGWRGMTQKEGVSNWNCWLRQSRADLQSKSLAHMWSQAWTRQGKSGVIQISGFRCR